jgi:TetR/AcrR family transcriptional regulator
MHFVLCTFHSDQRKMASTKPGERKHQILQTLAAMLENPKGEKITTAALAAKVEVSEAALYRHFASKAQMFEGLIEFIEASIFGLINQISEQQDDGLLQVQAIAQMLLNFAERNPGMTRVLTGDALVNEDERLQLRMNQLAERIEMAFRQSFRLAASQGNAIDTEAQVGPACYVVLSLDAGCVLQRPDSKIYPPSRQRYRSR